MDLEFIMIRAPSASAGLSSGRSRSRLGKNGTLTRTVFLDSNPCGVTCGMERYTLSSPSLLGSHDIVFATQHPSAVSAMRNGGKHDRGTSVKSSCRILSRRP